MYCRIKFLNIYCNMWISMHTWRIIYCIHIIKFYMFVQGENVTILCLSKNGWENDRFGYTWVKNWKLLKMDVPHIYYEDLYRGGSVLYVNNIQVSSLLCIPEKILWYHSLFWWSQSTQVIVVCDSQYRTDCIRDFDKLWEHN